jgi:hypothetical protein
VGYSGVQYECSKMWEYSGSTVECSVGYSMSTVGVQWEYSGSTVRVQWEYSMSTVGVQHLVRRNLYAEIATSNHDPVTGLYGGVSEWGVCVRSCELCGCEGES